MTTDTTTILSKFPVLVFVAAHIAVTSVLAYMAYHARQPSEIPNAAAEEARIVCANFSGLDRFTVARLEPETTPEGTLTRYRITATCTSQHTVTGTIGVKQ